MKVISVSIDVEAELDDIEKSLGNLQSRAKTALRTALNKTARTTKTKDEKAAKSIYTAKSKLGKLTLNKATAANLQAVLHQKEKNIGMEHFKRNSARSSLKVTISNLNGAKVIGKYGNKAFVCQAGDCAGLIMVRKTKDRFPLEKMSSVAPAVTHGTDTTWEQVGEEYVRQQLRDNVAEEVERILNK